MDTDILQKLSQRDANNVDMTISVKRSAMTSLLLLLFNVLTNSKDLTGIRIH